MDSKEHFVFWISKLLYVVFYIAIPVLFVGWSAWAIGFACMHLVMGLVLAVVFQLAHVVEHTEFEVIGLEPKYIENEWAIHQVKTTANFAPRNKIISWFVGGLNFQVEHHLFPKISHVHYPAISRIVENTCKRFDLPYNNYPTMTGAVASHFRMLKQLGRRPSQEYAVQRIQ
jgi:linoleoyl-CoA desaturase